MSAIRCLIVEDQRPAQRVLESYIRDLPHLEHVASCGSAMEAMEILRQAGVDIALMPQPFLHLRRPLEDDRIAGRPGRHQRRDRLPQPAGR